MGSIIDYMIQTCPYLKNLYDKQEEDMANGKLKSVGSLWKGQSKNGTMLSGVISLGLLGEINLMVFPNTNKKKATDPDYFCSIKVEDKEENIPLPPKNDDL